MTGGNVEMVNVNGWRLALVERKGLDAYVRFLGKRNRKRVASATLRSKGVTGEVASKFLAALAREGEPKP